MLKKVLIVIGIVFVVLFIFNKSKVGQSPEEIVEIFMDELTGIEGGETKNTIQNYFDSVGVKSNEEIYEAAKKAKDISIVTSENYKNSRIIRNAPNELLEPMESMKRNMTISYGELAIAFNYAMEYYGGDFRVQNGLSFKQHYDKAIALQDDVINTLGTLDSIANRLGDVKEDKVYNKSKNRNYPPSEKQSNKSNSEDMVKNKTGETSKLSLMDFVEKVNKLSMESVEYSLLHRPTYLEMNATDMYSFIAITQEDIVIVTDKNSIIKEIIWNSEEPLTEEILLSIQWLILSVEDTMSYDQVNAFIFHETLTKQRFGNFLVEYHMRENGFSFSMISKE